MCYRTALLAGRSRLLVARLCCLRVLLWHCNQSNSSTLTRFFLRHDIVLFILSSHCGNIENTHTYASTKCTYKLYVSFAQEQPPTHFAPIRKKTEDVRPQKHTQTHLVNYNIIQFSSNVYLIRWWCCIDPATLTVEVSLSRAFIWRISLQMSLLPSESSSDLGETETPLLVTNWFVKFK